MLNIFKYILLLFCAGFVTPYVSARNLVLLHTNDTHSQIDTDDMGRGGILPRKAIIDSVRAAEPNVILIDAGDIVQGSLYYRIFRGDVEFPLMNELGYDYMILGNHEFDNGIDELARHYKNTDARKLSSNYDFTGTPLDGIFLDYDIRTIDGKKIGFFGINVDPKGLIIDNNIQGVLFRDIITEANRVAEFLKKKMHCDLVVAITHIGYKNKKKSQLTDLDLARSSKYIDIIIGGHSHTSVDPNDPAQYLVKNSAGKDVLVTQTGKNGYNLGQITINLDRIGKPNSIKYSWIPVTDRFPSEIYDSKIRRFLSNYKAQVDSINRVPVGYSLVDMPDKSPEIANFTADFARQYAQQKLDSLNLTIDGTLPQRVDLSIMNIGGIRNPFRAGEITEGKVLSTYPFPNHIVLLNIKGSDLEQALRSCAEKGGEAVSNQVLVVNDTIDNQLHITIDNAPSDPERIYTVCTIDYLAWGNDGLEALANGDIFWIDNAEISEPILAYIRRLTENGLPINPDPRPRFIDFHYNP